MHRRSFLAVAGLAGVRVALRRRREADSAGLGDAMPRCGAGHRLARPTGAHPAPRKGVTGAKVLAAAKLAKWPDLVKVFDGIRTIPHVADGIRCSCGCADLPGYYSLLSCYEGDEAMAMICPICQGAGKLTVRLHSEGRTLAEIRIAVDAQFG